MGQTSSLAQPTFLKTGHTSHDLNAQAALTLHAILRSKEGIQAGAEYYAPKSFEIYIPDLSDFRDLSAEDWKDLCQFVGEHPLISCDQKAKEVSPENEERVAGMICTAQQTIEHRERLKALTEGRDVFLLSMCVSDSSIGGWVESLEDDQERVVKMTDQSTTVGGDVYSKYLRLACHDVAKGILRRTGPQLAYSCPFRLLSTQDDVHLGIATKNAVMWDGKTGEVKEATLSAAQSKALQADFDEAAAGKKTTVEVMGSADELLSPAEDQEQVDKNRFIVLLSSDKSGNSTSTAQLQSTLSDKVVGKVEKTKEKIPTQTYAARRLTQKRGSVFKRASSVSLCLADFGNSNYKRRVISAHSYEQ